MPLVVFFFHWFDLKVGEFLSFYSFRIGQNQILSLNTVKWPFVFQVEIFIVCIQSLFGLDQRVESCDKIFKFLIIMNITRVSELFWLFLLFMTLSRYSSYFLRVATFFSNMLCCASSSSISVLACSIRVCWCSLAFCSSWKRFKAFFYLNFQRLYPGLFGLIFL